MVVQVANFEKTPHFKKCKEFVKGLLKSFGLIDVTLIGSATKPDR